MCTSHYLIVHLMMPQVHEVRLKQLSVAEVDPSDCYQLAWIVGDWLLIFYLEQQTLLVRPVALFLVCMALLLV
jgi:hypothetical protein